MVRRYRAPANCDTLGSVDDAVPSVAWPVWDSAPTEQPPPRA